MMYAALQHGNQVAVKKASNCDSHTCETGAVTSYCRGVPVIRSSGASLFDHFKNTTEIQRHCLSHLMSPLFSSCSLPVGLYEDDQNSERDSSSHMLPNQCVGEMFLSE